MSEPDEAMVDAVALALFAIDYPNTDWHDGISADIHDDFRDYARAVLSVPVVRDALARDAQVQVVLKKWEYDFRRDSDGVAIDAISNIYEDVSLDAGDRDNSEEQR